MYKKPLKLVLIGLVVMSGLVVLGGGKASAASASYVNESCNGAPYDTWGNHDVSGEGAGVMASLRVKAYSTDAKDDKKLINTDYTLKSSGNPDSQIFNYSNWQKYKKGTYNANRDGAWRTSQQTFNTGEWLTGGSNGPYRCNGWSVLAPGQVVRDDNTGDRVRLVGNGWILDCRDSNNNLVRYSFSNLGAPDGQSGYWTLAQWDKSSGKMVENPTKFAPGSGGVSVWFNVLNGENNTIHLIWHPDPTWKLKGHTGLNKTTAAPGQKVIFDHTVRNTEGSKANYQWRISTKPLGSSAWSNSSWQSESNVASGDKKPYQTKREYEIPESASNGQTYCQRIEYTNKFGGSASDPTRTTSNPANSSWPDDDNEVKCVTVSKKTEPATPKCRYLYVKSPGTYKPGGGEERATRTLVKVDNVNVTEVSDGVADYNNIPAENGVAKNNDHMTWDVYNGTNTKFSAVPDDSGSKTQKDRLWKFVPTSKNIRVVVIEQWFYPGGDNPATKKKVETDYNKGWHNISTSDDTISCVSATCTPIQVTGTGPGGRVLAGETATITATINNTGSVDQGTRLFGVSFKFDGRRTAGDTGKIPPGESGTVELENVSVPKTPNYTIPGHPDLQYWYGVLTEVKDSKISDLLLTSCAFAVPIYDHFDVYPIPYAKLQPTDEAATSFDYWGGAFTINTKKDVTMNWSACIYREPLEPRDGNLCRTPTMKPSVSGKATFNGTIQIPYTGTETGIQPVQAGNQFCTVFDVQYTSGYIGSDGSIVDGIKDPAISPIDNCDGVENMPYFKAYGKGIRAGGDFSGVCKTGGLLAGWNDTSGANNRGASSQLSALALIKITGVASAQAKPGVSPMGLTFANNDPVTVPSSPDSPYLGGKYATSTDSERFCFDDVQPPADVQAPAGDPKAGTSGSQKYSNNGSPRVLDGSTSVATDQSVFVEGDVYIDSNIKYDNWSDSSNIPSFILRATGNIYISSDVTQLDGVYIAGNKIYTCADSSTHKQKTGSALYEGCNNQLLVNGVFIAKQVNLMRTYGSLRKAQPVGTAETGCPNAGTASVTNSCAAEYFNFSPELYLAKPKVQSANGGTGRYDSIVSLPPVL